jgi:hypothetical protein
MAPSRGYRERLFEKGGDSSLGPNSTVKEALTDV